VLAAVKIENCLRSLVRDCHEPKPARTTIFAAHNDPSIGNLVTLIFEKGSEILVGSIVGQVANEKLHDVSLFVIVIAFVEKAGAF
jgi:hypothetical protein